MLDVRSLLSYDIVDTTDPVWCIGDVHGCLHEFDNLVTKIKILNPTATIIQLGDLIDRGPYFLELFQLCKQENIKLVMGNHELNFIAEHVGLKPCRSRERAITHEKMKSYTESDQDFILEMMYSMLPSITVGQHLLTHSPLTNSKMNFARASACTYALSRQGDLDNACYVNKNVHGHMHWEYVDIETQMKYNEKNVYNIDSGCVYGQYLLGFCLSHPTYIKEPSLKTYFVERKEK